MLHYSKLFSEYHTLTLENVNEIISRKPSSIGLSRMCLLMLLKIKYKPLTVVHETLSTSLMAYPQPFTVYPGLIAYPVYPHLFIVYPGLIVYHPFLSHPCVVLVSDACLKQNIILFLLSYAFS